MSGGVQVIPRPMPTSELDIETVLSHIDSDRKLLQQRDVSELSQREFEERVAGGRVARFGARVISVEGESWKEGMNITQGRGMLGRFIKSEEFNDLLKITFTTQRGLFVGDSDTLLPPEKRTQHPLSKDGFYVQKDGGFMTLDEGYLLLLSRSGVFAGGGGYTKAREIFEKYSYEVNNNHNLMDRNHALSVQLKHSEEMQMILSVAREDFQHWGQEQQEKFRHAWDTLAKFRDQISSLRSELEGVQWTNVHQEQIIKERLTDIDILARELRTFVADDKIFETLKQASARVPDLSVHQTYGLKERLKRTGFIREDPNEKLIAEQKKAIEELTRQVEEARRAAHPTPPRPPPPPYTPPDADEDDEDIVDGDDDDAETEEPDEPPKNTPPAKSQDTPKKPTMREKISMLGGKVVQDVKDTIGKSVARTPKEEKEAEPQEEEPPQEEAVEPSED